VTATSRPLSRFIRRLIFFFASAAANGNDAANGDDAADGNDACGQQNSCHHGKISSTEALEIKLNT
jgi:hypothetical protein